MLLVRRRLAPILVSLGVVAAALLGAAPSASAAPGAIGGITYYSGTCRYENCPQTRDVVRGWAYNQRTVPSQAVQLRFYYLCGTSGGCLSYTTDDILANRVDDADARAHHLHTDRVGFSYDSGWVNSHARHGWMVYRVCAWAHDRGEHGGYVKIGCRNNG